ncbi:MAG: hypothetical protein IPG39_14475 [Bacteroidetes bacterium]|nr:hypothetical protein [Bacteroidota bacterium]
MVYKFLLSQTGVSASSAIARSNTVITVFRAKQFSPDGKKWLIYIMMRLLAWLILH